MKDFYELINQRTKEIESLQDKCLSLSHQINSNEQFQHAQRVEDSIQAYFESVTEVDKS